jgi:four helix bundle protein
MEKNMTKPHKTLDVWNKAINLTVDTYRCTGSFPKNEVYGLTSQVRRTAVSVASNIAQGGLKETIVDDHNGYMVKDFNPNEIASRIQLFTDNLMFANEMGERARKYVQERWNYETGINNIEAYLASLVGEKRGTAET